MAVKKVPKKTTMLIQLDADLKRQFQQLCKSEETTSSQAIRRYMKMSLLNYKNEQMKNVFK